MFWVLFAEALFFLVAASVQDIRTREVYDRLSYSFIALALLTRLIWFALEWDVGILLYTAPAFAVMFGFSMVMYVAGQWGGGDAKLMAGLAIALGGSDLYFLDFLMNMLVFGALYGVVYTLGLGLRHREELIDELPVWLSIASIIAVPVAVYATVFPLGRVVSFMVLLLLSAKYLQIIEKECMYARVPVGKLVEGDWLAEEVDGIEKRGTGLGKDQIEKLKSMDVKKVRVKEGIPFVPAFVVTLVGTQLLGNLLLSLANYQYLGGLVSFL